MTRNDALNIACRLYERQEGTPAQTQGFRQALVLLLDALAAAGAFDDGRNMTDRLAATVLAKGARP